MNTRIIGAFALLVAVAPSLARAAAPGRFVYQGRLSQADPPGPASGPLKMTFSIYGQADGGSPLWSETQPSVALTDGYYVTSLGDQVALSADLFTNGERFLELAVDEQPLLPRERLASVPSALTCTSLHGGPVAATSLSAQGGLAVRLAGVVAASPGSSTVVGSGTHFQSELKVGDAVRVGTAGFRVTRIASDTSLDLDPAPAEGFPAGTTIYRDGTLFRVANGAQTTQVLVSQGGDLGVHTDSPLASLSFGKTHSAFASGCLDKPHGFVWNGACRNDVMSVWESGETKYGFGIHDSTLEVFSHQFGRTQIGIRNDGSGNASLTGQFTPTLEVGDGYLRAGNVSAPSSNTQPGAGSLLYLSGGPSWSDVSSENSDTLALYRYNVSPNVTEMRVLIGDDACCQNDSFVVGATDSTNSNVWTPALTVYSNGNYKFAGANVSTRESKKDIQPFDERALDLLRPVQVVNYRYKEDHADRALRVGIIANDPGRAYDPRLTNNGTGFDPQTAAALLIKAVQEQQSLLDAQRAELARLHAIVCHDHPNERLCQP